MRLAAVLVVLLSAGVADADPGPFDVLTHAGTTWTYKLDKEPKPLVVTIKAGHAAGAYTAIEVDSLDDKATLIVIGPDGLRAGIGSIGDDATKIYNDEWLPAVWLPAALAPSKRSVGALSRFGQDDREYDRLKRTISKNKDGSWHVAWTGRYDVPEEGAGGPSPKHDFRYSFDFDPAKGFTTLCADGAPCMRLVSGPTPPAAP